jgi:phosphopantothenate synthetase
MPLLVDEVKRLQKGEKKDLRTIFEGFDNKKILTQSILHIRALPKK